MTASAELFRRQGFGSTGLKEVAALAKAPFGSLYHFFPRGKEQLGEEVIRESGRLYLRLIDESFANVHDLPGALRAFFAGAAATVQFSDFADACPIATVALEVASTNETLRRATADVFASWLTAAAERFAAAGLPTSIAQQLAVQTFCALEGAFVLSRSTRHTQPIQWAGDLVAAAAERAIADGCKGPARRRRQRK